MLQKEEISRWTVRTLKKLIPEFSYDVSELANVVYALVKRASNSPKNLQAICQQSLQEFLGESTQNFVNMLVNKIESNSTSSPEEDTESRHRGRGSPRVGRKRKSFDDDKKRRDYDSYPSKKKRESDDEYDEEEDDSYRKRNRYSDSRYSRRSPDRFSRRHGDHHDSTNRNLRDNVDENEAYDPENASINGDPLVFAHGNNSGQGNWDNSESGGNQSYKNNNNRSRNNNNRNSNNNNNRRGGGGGGGNQRNKSHFDKDGNYKRGKVTIPRDSCTLLVLNIPKESNSITALNNHFEQFGPVTQIEVKQSQEKALVRFASHQSAVKAFKSPTPILGNRFIKVFWPKENQTLTKSQDSSPEEQATAPTSQNTFKQAPEQHHQPAYHQQSHAPHHHAPPMHHRQHQHAPPVYHPPPPAIPAGIPPVAPKPVPDAAMQQFKEELQKLSSKQTELLQHLKSDQLDAEQKTKIREELLQVNTSVKNLLASRDNSASDAAKKNLAVTTAERKKKLDEELNQIATTSTEEGITAAGDQAKPTGTTVIEEKLDELRQTAATMGFDGSMQQPPQFNFTPYRGAPRGGFRARARAVYPRGAPVWNPRGGIPRGAAAYYYRGAPPPRGAPRGAARGASRPRNEMVIDNRTTAISISNPPPSFLNRTSVFAHFQAYGPIDQVEITDGTIIVKFATRRDAERAMREGNTFESVNLNMNWVKWANNKSDDQNTQEEVLNYEPVEENTISEYDDNSFVLEEQESIGGSDDEEKSWKR